MRPNSLRTAPLHLGCSEGEQLKKARIISCFLHDVKTAMIDHSIIQERQNQPEAFAASRLAFSIRVDRRRWSEGKQQSPFRHERGALTKDSRNDK
jgi:hypothetical protein